MKFEELAKKYPDIPEQLLYRVCHDLAHDILILKEDTVDMYDYLTDPEYPELMEDIREWQR